MAALLVFTVSLSPGALAQLRVKVDLVGVKGELRANAEAHLGIFATSKGRGKRAPSALTEKSIQRQHMAATGEIQAALKPFGYYSPEITANLSVTDNLWLASYVVDPGPPTRLREVVVAIEGEGEFQAELLRLLASSTLAPGDRLRHTDYENLKNSLRNAAYALGYLDSTFRRSTIDVHPRQQLADITLVLDTGPRFYFGDVIVEQAILSRTFIEQFVSIKSGEPFEPRRLTELQIALTSSNYFASAEVNIQRELAQDERIPVRVLAQPSKSQRYETSLGYGTDTGPRGGAGVLWRRLNEHGHQFRMDLRLSEIQSALASQYKVPVGDVGSEYLDFTAEVMDRRINDVDAISYVLGSSLNQNAWGGRRRAALELRHDVWAFGNESSENATLLIPSIEYARMIADDLLFTRSGYSAKVVVNGAVKEAMSDASFLQAKISGRYIRPLGERGRLLIRGEYGATMIDDFHRLPPSQRFFNGGAQNVRGYGFEELSPRDDQRNRIGGRYLGTASVEVDYLVYGNFGLALFVDAGNASNDPDINWKSAAGVGLRYKSPVGMFRLDFAHPFDDPDSSFAFHISFGPDLQ